MKKLLIATLLMCLAGFPASCDKDDDNNPFAKTVWKCKTQISFPITGGGTGSISGYKCIEFKANYTYVRFEEDENGVVVKRWSSGSPYKLRHNEKGKRVLTYYYDGNSVAGEINCDDGVPGSFSEIIDGKKHIYVRQ